MFAKRPLLGWSCASCDKDIVNLSGRPAEFHPWMKLPARDPTDRISRVGQGFSRMLSQVRPEFIEKLRMSRLNQTLTNFNANENIIDEEIDLKSETPDQARAKVASV